MLKRIRFQTLSLAVTSFCLCWPLLGAAFLFDVEELPTRLSVGYAVRLLDMNGDRRLDIVIVDSKRILWLENPHWREHVLIEDASKQHDNVCLAPADIDGDGQVDFAVGADWQFNNTREGGSIGWIGRTTPGAPWEYHPIGQEPTVHRMRFADLDADGRPELVVVPLKGRDTTPPLFMESGVRILAYPIPSDPARDPWVPQVINRDLHVAHNFWPTDLNGDGGVELLVASSEGVSLLERSGNGEWTRTLIGAGDQGSSATGASEVKLGHFSSGEDYLATIEPFHGDKVVVYTRPDEPRPVRGPWLWSRQIVDVQLKWGHAVWCADLDSDGDEELIIGVRDSLNQETPRGLRVYDPQEGGARWERHLIDPDSVAIEDLAAADLDQDDRVDIVAVGRQTHNVRIYRGTTP